MAEPLRENEPTVPENLRNIKTRSSADVPAYDTYPAEPQRSIDWQGRQEHWRGYGSQNPRLNETAEKIGSAVGEMVNRAQGARQKFSSVQDDMRRGSESKVDEIKQRAENFKQRAQEQWANVTDTAQQRLEDWKRTALDSAQNAREQIVQRTRAAGTKGRAYVNENPHHVILGIAGAAFAVGLAARIWRSRD